MDLTILSLEQVYGIKQLAFFKKRGVQASMTDFAILAGGEVFYDKKAPTLNFNGCYWTKTDDKDGDAFAISENGDGLSYSIDVLEIGVRVACCYKDSFLENSSNIIFNRVEDGTIEIEYGYYPQMAVSNHMQKILEDAYKSGVIKKPGNVYTTNSDDFGEICPRSHIEYEYAGKRYVRVEATNACENSFVLSNGKKYTQNSIVWVEVSPIKWLVDEQHKIMVTEKIVLSGIFFNNKECYKTENFNDTILKEFLDTYFSKEICQYNNVLNNDHEIDRVFQIHKQLKQKIKNMSFDEKKKFLESYLDIKNNDLEEFKSYIKYLDGELFAMFNDLYIRQNLDKENVDITPKVFKKKRLF